MTTTRLHYSRDEILTDPDYATRIERSGVLLHGGYAADGTYLPPRSVHRVPAIAAWAAQLEAGGHSSRVIEPDAVDRAFVPNTEQAKMLLRNGAAGAMTRILTLVGVVEGFGNDGIKLIPPMDLQSFIVEPIDGTCLGHLFAGLLEAHGNDEAGRGDEAGHDQMWFAVRDAALSDPPITIDMFENLPIAPPPGYEGPAKPSPEAITVGGMLEGLRDDVAPELQLLVRAMVQILVIELLAYHTFAWASDVLGDPTCSADAEFARATIDHIRTDEDIHVAYLQCGLAELATMTVRTIDGGTVAGAGEIKHGKTSKIHHDGKGVFKDIGDQFNAVRYHSLAGTPETTPDVLDVTARSESGVIMGVRHKTLKVEGVQFHPESIATEHGKELLKNFLDMEGGTW
jgi:GMP synthase-like glutamine amidotransferase